MSTGIRCSSCGYDNLLFGKYCNQCGKALTQACNVCAEENVIEAKFCRSCAIELTKAPRGLYLDRAFAWREQFRTMGWQEWGLLTEEDWKAIAPLNLPEINDVHEPWVFAAMVDGGSMKPERVDIDKEVYARAGAFGTHGCIISTRCRLAVVNFDSGKGKGWNYIDLNSYAGSGNNSVVIVTDAGQSIKLGLKLPSAGTIDVIAAVAASDPVAKVSARHSIETKAGVTKSFVQVVGDFLYDIVVRTNQQ